MKKLLILFGVAVLLICVGLSGCFDGKSISIEEQRFVGTWDMEGMESPVMFHSNGQISGFLGKNLK